MEYIRLFNTISEYNTFTGTPSFVLPNISGIDEEIEQGNVGLMYNPIQNCQYEAVDLGLSVKWATFNVGATGITDYGNYYQWGAVEPYQNTDQYYTGTTDLPLSRDIANLEIGGNWRMPTSGECRELILGGDTTLSWVTIDGVNGVKVQSNITGFQDKWIFLPASGAYIDGTSSYIGLGGLFWTKTRLSETANLMTCYETVSDIGNTGMFYFGCSVRPVLTA